MIALLPRVANAVLTHTGDLLQGHPSKDDPVAPSLALSVQNCALVA